jgi:hypothetical protein
MMTQELVSVIVPAYNAEKTTGESGGGQKLKPWCQTLLTKLDGPGISYATTSDVLVELAPQGFDFTPGYQGCIGQQVPRCADL